MKTPLVLSGALLMLAGCNTVTFHDTLVRAKIEGPLPHPPVHLPGRDSSTFRLQGSLALSTTTPDPVEVQLLRPDQSDNDGNTGHGRVTTWDQGVVSGSGEISLLMGNHVRLFGGLQGDLNKKARWIGAGALLGRKRPLEIALASGSTSLSRELTGYRVTTVTDNCPDSDRPECVPNSESTRGTDTTEWNRSNTRFTRLSLTWSPRGGGPWAEVAYTRFAALARTIQGDWTYDAESFQVGAGYAFPTPVGFLVAGARAQSLGEGITPSLVLQFTGDVPIE